MSYTVKKAAKLAGISVRTLHHYDHVGLLAPSAATEAGYRLYADADMARLQQILFYRDSRRLAPPFQRHAHPTSFGRSAVTLEIRRELTQCLHWAHGFVMQVSLAFGIELGCVRRGRSVSGSPGRKTVVESRIPMVKVITNGGSNRSYTVQVPPAPPIDYAAIQKEQRVAAMGADKAVFKARDANGDGKLSRQEFKQGDHQGREDFEKNERFDTFDQNGDGGIDRKEWGFGRAWERLLDRVAGTPC